jgi:hypothetical protein
MGSIVISSGAFIERTANLPSFSAVTLAGWVKLLSSTAGTARYIGGLRTNSTAQMSMVQYTDNAFFGNSGGFLSNQLSPAPADDVWVYFAITQGGGATSTTRWWNASGVLQDSKTCDATTGTCNGMTVGARAGYNDNQRNGRYAYWKVWDAELSQSEIEADMFLPTFYASGAHYADRNTGFADNGTDISGNSRDWTLTGTSTDSDTPPVLTGCTITDAGDELYRADDSVTITGTNFGAVEGDVYVSPTDNIADAAKVTQMVTSWGDTSITFTAVRGALTPGATLYLFVVPDTNDPNADGYSVAFEYVPITLTWAM